MSSTGLDWRAARDEAHRQGALLRRPQETAGLDAAVGRVLAADLSAPGAVPGHDGAAMDGWAVAGEGPWRVGEPIVAGADPTSEALGPGRARPVTTGAPVPPGTDAVVRSEDADVDGSGLLVRHTVSSTRRHVRPAGEEVARGELLFPAGTRLTPPRVALAAAAGVDDVPVIPVPGVRVAVLGDEVVGAGVPRPGRVRDVFSTTLPHVLRALGAVPSGAVRVPDDLGATARVLDGADAGLVVTTGGTAGSSADHVRGALDRIGAEVLLDHVDVRPGRPALLARRGDTLYLCLPGNPMAAMVALVLLGEPLVAGMTGRPAEAPTTVTTAVDLPNDRPGSLVLAYRSAGAGVAPAGAVPAGVVPVRHQGSAMLRGLADADGLLVVEPGGRNAGESVPALALPWR